MATVDVGKATAGVLIELGTLGILIYGLVNGPESTQLLLAGVIGSAITARTMTRSRAGTGIGSIPPPRNPGMKNEDIPKRPKTGFTNSPPDTDEMQAHPYRDVESETPRETPQAKSEPRIPSLKFVLEPLAVIGSIALTIVTLSFMVVAVITAVNACGPQRPPTLHETSFAAEMQSCVAVSKTRPEYEDCRAAVTKKYGVDGGVRPL